MARPQPVHLHTPGPGAIVLEDDTTSPLMAPEHMLAMALDAKGRMEAELANARILTGHLTTIVCALIQLLKNDPATSHLVDRDGMVIIPNALADQVTGMQIEAVTTGDGDVGVIRRERAPELFVVGGVNG